MCTSVKGCYVPLTDRAIHYIYQAASCRCQIMAISSEV